MKPSWPTRALEGAGTAWWGPGAAKLSVSLRFPLQYLPTHRAPCYSQERPRPRTYGFEGKYVWIREAERRYVCKKVYDCEHRLTVYCASNSEQWSTVVFVALFC